MLTSSRYCLIPNKTQWDLVVNLKNYKVHLDSDLNRHKSPVMKYYNRIQRPVCPMAPKKGQQSNIIHTFTNIMQLTTQVHIVPFKCRMEILYAQLHILLYESSCQVLMIHVKDFRTLDMLDQKTVRYSSAAEIIYIQIWKRSKWKYFKYLRRFLYIIWQTLDWWEIWQFLIAYQYKSSQ